MSNTQQRADDKSGGASDNRNRSSNAAVGRDDATRNRSIEAPGAERDVERAPQDPTESYSAAVETVDDDDEADEPERIAPQASRG